MTGDRNGTKGELKEWLDCRTLSIPESLPGGGFQNPTTSMNVVIVLGLVEAVPRIVEVFHPLGFHILGNRLRCGEHGFNVVLDASYQLTGVGHVCQNMRVDKSYKAR